MKDFYNQIQKLFIYRFDAFETCARSFPPASNNHVFDKSRINCDKIYHSSTIAKQKLEIPIVLKWQRRSNNAEILFSKLTSKPSSLKKREKV